MILTLNLQGINYLGSRSIQHSYINATRLFRCATVITPVIILLRVFLRGPAAEWCITCRLRNHRRLHHTISPHLGAVEQGCTGVVTYKNSCPPPHPLYPSGVLSRHLSSPLCQISLEEVLLAGLVSAQQAAGGSGQRAPPVLSLPPPWAICNSSSATLNLLWPTCFAWWHRCHPITCHCLLYH